MTGTPGTSRTFTAPPPPAGNPLLLRACAADLRSLAAALRQLAAVTAAPLPPTWRGASATAAAATATRLAAELRVAAGAVEDMAAHLERYATALAAASAHHHSWLKRAAEVAGVVLVTAAVVTITVATAGAAAPVAAGLAIEAEAGAATAGGAAAGGAAAAETTATAAVAGMETAAASASAAEASLVDSLGAQVLPRLQQLAAFVKPQLVGAEVSTGFDAAVRVRGTGTVSGIAVGVDLVENVAVGGAVGAAASRWLVKPGIAARLGRIIQPAAAGADLRPAVVRHLSNAGTNTGVNVVESEVTGQPVTRDDIGLDFAQGLVGSRVGDAAAAHDTRVARVVNATRNSRLPRLRVDAGGRVLAALPGTVYRVDPQVIRFSQNSIGRTDLRVTALSAGWDGDPISVVVMPDGSLTSFDNRRVMAARRLGLQANVVIRDPAATVPADLLATRFKRYRLPAGATWLDAIDARIADQRAWKGAHPFGRLELPARINPGAVHIVGIRPPRAVTRAV